MKGNSFQPGEKSRYLAALVAHAVIYKGESLRQWANNHNQPSLTPETKKFFNSYLLGSLRWFIQNKIILTDLLNSPIKNKDKIVEVLLCSAIYEITRMRTPDYAVVASTVEAAKIAQKGHLKSLVNAVLRNFIRAKGKFITKARQSPEGHYSFPSWFIKQTKKDYPNDWQSVLDASNQIPTLWLCINTSKISLVEYRQQLLQRTGHRGVVLSGFPDAIGIQQGTNPVSLPGFADNLFHVQTPGAQMAAEILQPEKDDIILDACAAPGSKGLHLLNKERSINLTAIEISKRRFKILEENFARAQLRATLVCNDLLTPEKWWNKKKYTKILLDVPCSSSGVINRDQDIKYLRRPSDIDIYHQRQVSLLGAAWSLLENNGLLLYCTCSIFSDENAKTIKQFLALNKDASTLTIKNVLAVKKWGLAKAEKGVQLVPGKGLNDGFFYTLLHKAHKS